eukprot:TRINITY_DN52289_c0_g1_i1.p1 TRINITY_DN52289_c0_g1~~TRINITY_DN52289_c0_g1_i1.p1  ORF type:complete len:241 (-),score=29.69 TRINITY_DN52289_c0_g1_i1:73-795(-)
MRPLNQFCCGCSLKFGVLLFLTCNLIQSLWFIFMASSNIILKIPAFGHEWGLIVQTLNAAFCLFGLPFIASGYWGVMYRLETNLLLYLFYAVIQVLGEASELGYYLIVQGLCGSMPRSMSEHGAAFACGFLRLTTLLVLVLVIIVRTYCVYTVWSLCEDFKVNGGDGFGDLMKHKGDSRKKLLYAAPNSYGEDAFLGGHGVGGGRLPVAYGAFHSPQVGGARQIFQGKYHETAYPPSAAF